MTADLIRNKAHNLLGLLLVRFCVKKSGMLRPETFGSQSRANHIKPLKGDFFFLSLLLACPISTFLSRSDILNIESKVR